MSHYPDSSFLVSCYVADPNTPQAKSYLSKMSAPLIFTALHVLEVRNAFQLGVFRRLFTSADALAARANLDQDLRSGRLIKATVKWPIAFRVAARLSERYSITTGTRSLDILHVATAKTMRAERFVSFDGRQRSLAAAAGLIVEP